MIETSTPSFSATLRFSTGGAQSDDLGYYEIHHLPRGGVETGKILNVTEVPANETDSRVSMLAPFATRYWVRTVGHERPNPVQIWLVGLDDFRTVDDADIADDEAISLQDPEAEK